MNDFEQLKKDSIKEFENNFEQAKNESEQLTNEQKDHDIDRAWDQKSENQIAYEKRQIKREKVGEEEVAKRNRRQFSGVEPDNLPYFEDGERQEVLYSKNNIKFFDQEDLALIKEDIAEDGTDAEKKMIEQLLERLDHLMILEDKAKDAFRNMLAMEKGSGERAAAYQEWMNARNHVVEFEQASLDMVFAQKSDTPDSHTEDTNQDSLQEAA